MLDDKYNVCIVYARYKIGKEVECGRWTIVEKGKFNFISLALSGQSYIHRIIVYIYKIENIIIYG